MPVALHGLQKIARLVGDRFERRPRQFGCRRAARQPEDRAARLGVPIGRAETDEGRHQIDALLLVGLPASAAVSVAFLMIFQPVAEPLHRRAGDEDRSFQGIGSLAVELVGDGREQPVAASAPPAFRY